MPYYLQSTGGFYDDAPTTDAVLVSDYQRDQLLAQQYQGKVLTVKDGMVIAVDPVLALSTRRDLQRQAINEKRDSLIYGGLTYAGYVFQSDRDSRRRIANAASGVDFSAAVPTNYEARTLDNVNVRMSGPQMVDFALHMHNHEIGILAISRVLKDMIMASSNPESVTWPDNTPVPSDEPLLGEPTLNMPAAARLATTALQPGDVPAQPTLSKVATTGKYDDLSGKPTIPAAVDTTAFATKAQGAKADTAVQPADLPKPAIQMAITIGSAGTGEGTLSGYTTAPKVTPVPAFSADQMFVAEIVSVTATKITVRAKRSRGTLLLTTGPFETAPAGTVVYVLVNP